MQKNILFVIAAAVVLTAFVSIALYTVNVNAQAPAGGNATSMNKTSNMTNATAAAKPNATNATD